MQPFFMKKSLVYIIFGIFFVAHSQQQNATFSVTPTSFDENENITINISGIDASEWGVEDLYLWAWYFKNGVSAGDSPNNGTWENSQEEQKLTKNSDGSYSISFVPTEFFNDSGISQMGILAKAKDGTDDKKTQDYLHYVGKVQVEFISPKYREVVVNDDTSLSVSAQMSSAGQVQVGDFELYLNDNLIHTGQGFPIYSYTINNISVGGKLKIKGKPSGQTDFGETEINIHKSPSITNEDLPSQVLDGININSPTSVTLVLNAPNKDYVYVAGSFNNYTPDESYLMKKDQNSGKFWLSIDNLNANEIYTYQYWVYDANPSSNSPYLVKTADPFSTLVASPFDDPNIPESNYPNIPTYPNGQNREVTILETVPTSYNWNEENFVKPEKEDLVIYEVLIRDFDTNRTFKDLTNRIDYFKNLNVNAIELMPVMEFEGNENWGYATSFHMSLDKFYGTSNDFKEFVDTCHQNGIAVILDLALNHVTGRSPMVRMWMEDTDDDGWGESNSENPYLNSQATHTYSVFNDFNHSSSLTQDYTKRVIKHWIEEYKIDGFRWDLTKGFTQNCSSGDYACTEEYQQDRIDVLKSYADYSWSLDPNHYVIFEHIGNGDEEKEWADYRINEGKGVMLWGKMIEEYGQLSMGYTENSSLNRIRSESRGFAGKRLIGYAESHDEERLMRKNIQYGNSSNSSHDVKNLNVSLSRMSAIGALSLLVPGPKMIWHFGDLGMETSLFTCEDGSIEQNDDCKLSTKPQPQWSNNWLSIAQRKKIYDDWSRMIELKKNNVVFRGNSSFSPISSNPLIQRLYIWDDNLADNVLKNIVILANLDVTEQNVVSNFPFTGDWFNLMDDSSINITNTDYSISLQPGEFLVFGNKQATLSTDDFGLTEKIQIIKNPIDEHILLNVPKNLIAQYSWKLYNTLGVKIDEGNISTTDSNIFQINSSIGNGVFYLVLKNNNSNEFELIKILK